MPRSSLTLAMDINDGLSGKKNKTTYRIVCFHSVAPPSPRSILLPAEEKWLHNIHETPKNKFVF